MQYSFQFVITANYLHSFNRVHGLAAVVVAAAAVAAAIAVAEQLKLSSNHISMVGLVKSADLIFDAVK